MDEESIDKITDADRKRWEPLANRLMCAFASYQLGISYNSMEKKGSKLGDYWILLAIQVSDQMVQARNIKNDAAERKPNDGQKGAGRKKAPGPIPRPSGSR